MELIKYKICDFCHNDIFRIKPLKNIQVCEECYKDILNQKLTKKCECGCKENIIITNKHLWSKLPKYINGHHLKIQEYRKKHSEFMKGNRYVFGYKYTKDVKRKISIAKLKGKDIRAPSFINHCKLLLNQEHKCPEDVAKELHISTSTLYRLMKEEGLISLYDKLTAGYERVLRIIKSEAKNQQEVYGITVPPIIVKRYNLLGKKFKISVTKSGKFILYTDTGLMGKNY